MNLSIKLNHLRIRIRTAFRILFGQELSWVFIYMDRDGLKKILGDEDVELDCTIHRMNEYAMRKTIKHTANEMDDIDMALMKAEFEGQVEFEINQRNENRKHDLGGTLR